MAKEMESERINEKMEAFIPSQAQQEQNRRRQQGNNVGGPKLENKNNDEDDREDKEIENKDGSPTKKGRKKKGSQGIKYRKDPQAPKRFKSPYILFSMSKMEEFKKDESSSKFQVASTSLRVSEAWKKLSKTEKEMWSAKAREDKIRFDAEKALYTGPWQMKVKRARKDPTAPKRPMSAFLFFSQGMRPRLKAENPNMKNTEISTLLGQRWKDATEEEKRPHVEREKREREQYKKDIAEWRKKKDEEDKAMKKRRQEIAEQYVKAGMLSGPPAFNVTPTVHHFAPSENPNQKQASTTTQQQQQLLPNSHPISFRPSVQGGTEGSITHPPPQQMKYVVQTANAPQQRQKQQPETESKFQVRNELQHRTMQEAEVATQIEVFNQQRDQSQQQKRTSNENPPLSS